jgi:diguanylate cyclase (GGDEF)-like protein
MATLVSNDSDTALSDEWVTLLMMKAASGVSLASRAELTADLHEIINHPDSPLAFVQIDIATRAATARITAGMSAPEGEMVRFPVYGLFNEISCWICMWYKPHSLARGAVHFPIIFTRFSEWVSAFWKGDWRSRSGFLTWNDRHLRTAVDSAIGRWLSQGLTVSALYVDVDHFKDINDAFGAAKADKVIEDLGDLLEQSVPANALVFIAGGDEFLIFMPTTDRGPLGVAISVMRSIKGHNFGTDHMTVSAALGVSSRAGRKVQISSEVLADEASKAMQRGTISKRRGRISLAPLTKDALIPDLDDETASTAAQEFPVNTKKPDITCLLT